MIGEFRNKKYAEPLKIAVMALANVSCKTLKALKIYMEQRDTTKFSKLSREDYNTYRTLLFAANTNLIAIGQYYTEETTQFVQSLSDQLSEAKSIWEVDKIQDKINTLFLEQKIN